MIWLRYLFVQCLQLVAALAGLIVLVPFCVTRAWRPQVSSFDSNRVIDGWSWAPLNYIYGNPEDGVSGERALIWRSDGSRVSYLPTSNSVWRAYCWSALRNPADGLKYVFAVPGTGPLKKVLGFKLGWQVENGKNVPVFGRV